MPNESLTLEKLIPLVAEARKKIDLLPELNKLYEDYREGKNQDRLIEVIEKCQAFVDPLETALQQEFRQRIRQASKDGILRASTPETAPTIFHEIWSSLIQDGWDALSESRQNQLAMSFGKVLIHSAVFAATATSYNATKAGVILLHLENGSLPETRGQDELWENWADGTRLWVSMDAWTPRLFARHKERDYRTPAQMPEGVMMHTTVDFPSGRLLVSDQVRVEPLTSILDNMRAKLGIRLNYAEHRITRTWFSAMQLGVVDVAVGNAGPGIVRDLDSGHLFAGREGPGFEPLARICNSYWGTTIVDREKLIELALRADDAQYTRESVEAEIEKWLASSEYASEITVEPGTWHLYWDDDRETLATKLPKDGIKTPQDARFALTKDPLDLTPDGLRNYTI